MAVAEQQKQPLHQRTLGVVDEKRRDVAAVELHALGRLQHILDSLAILDGDDTLLAHLVERLAQQSTDVGVPVRADGSNLHRAQVCHSASVSESQCQEHGRARAEQCKEYRAAPCRRQASRQDTPQTTRILCKGLELSRPRRRLVKARHLMTIGYYCSLPDSP